MIEKRTKKEFFPYNEYDDRGMALKWKTAFELGELTKSIDKSNEYSQRTIKKLPQQTEEQISYYLEQSLTHYKVLIIQLNTLDSLGRVLPPIVGTFKGFSNEDTLLIDDCCIDYADIRHIRLTDFTKWYDLNKKNSLSTEVDGVNNKENSDSFCEEDGMDYEFFE